MDSLFHGTILVKKNLEKSLNVASSPSHFSKHAFILINHIPCHIIIWKMKMKILWFFLLMMFHSELIQIGDGRRLMKKPFGISSGPTSFGRKTNNKSYYQIDCDIFVTPTITQRRLWLPKPNLNIIQRT